MTRDTEQIAEDAVKDSRNQNKASRHIVWALAIVSVLLAVLLAVSGVVSYVNVQQSQRETAAHAERATQFAADVKSLCQFYEGHEFIQLSADSRDLCDRAKNVVEDSNITTMPGTQGPPGPRGYPGMDGHDGRNGIDGVKGDQGATGETGAPGMDGQPSDPGANGSPGVNGADGKDGAPGPTGPPGPQGDQGPAGETGPVPSFTFTFAFGTYDWLVTCTAPADGSSSFDCGRAVRQ